METIRERILKELGTYHKKQGIAFISKNDAEDYFKGLTEIIEGYYEEGKIAGNWRENWDKENTGLSVELITPNTQ